MQDARNHWEAPPAMGADIQLAATEDTNMAIDTAWGSRADNCLVILTGLP